LDPQIRQGHTQTHGYHPILSCLTPSADTAYLALGAGPDLLLRRTGKKESWTLYKDRRSHIPGRDDITGLCLLTPDTAVVARANGVAQRIHLGAGGKANVLRRYDTGGKGVRAIHVAKDHTRVAAVLGTDTAAVFDMNGDGNEDLTVQDEGEQIWTCALLGSGHHLALGKSGVQPLAVHEITPTGIEATATRSFCAAECAEMAASSVFAVAELPGSNGSCLFAGWYKGSTQLVAPPSRICPEFSGQRRNLYCLSSGC
jgi:hypothetical protein